jgi:hypothetical protein
MGRGPVLPGPHQLPRSGQPGHPVGLATGRGGWPEHPAAVQLPGHRRSRHLGCRVVPAHVDRRVWTLVFGDGALTLPSGDFSFNQQIQLVVAYDGEPALRSTAPGCGRRPLRRHLKISRWRRCDSVPSSGTPPRSSIITGAYRLRSLVLKQEALDFISGFAGLVVPERVQEFIARPARLRPEAAVRDRRHALDATTPSCASPPTSAWATRTA